MLNRILSSKEKINTSNKRLCKVLSALILVLSLVLSLAGCSGADIAESCKGDTIIVKNGEVVSTNMNLGDNGLKSAGITDEMIRSENFNVTIDGTTYSLSSMPSGEYTIISGQAATESGFNMIYGDVIPCAAGVVMIIISAIILSLGTTKKKENE